MPRERPIADWKVALFSSGALAVLFVVFGGWSTGYAWRSIAVLAVAGGLLGAVAAPDLEPAAFPHATLWQVSFAILGGLLIAFHENAGPLGYSLAVLIGGILGFFARYWTKYINI